MCSEIGNTLKLTIYQHIRRKSNFKFESDAISGMLIPITQRHEWEVWENLSYITLHEKY